MAYAKSVYFVVTNITTVGYGVDRPTTERNMLLSNCIQFFGIIFYGYTLQQVLIFIRESQSYSEMKIEREESLDSWLICKERKSSEYKNITVLKKIQIAFRFYWKWDIESNFEADFFHQLPLKIKDQLAKEPVEFILKYFSAFFKNLEYQDSKVLALCLKPKL
jgi:hypothetical protein